MTPDPGMNSKKLVLLQVWHFSIHRHNKMPKEESGEFSSSRLSCSLAFISFVTMQYNPVLPCVFGACFYTGNPTLACCVCNKHVVDPVHFADLKHMRYAHAATAQPLSAATDYYFQATLARNWPGAAVANARLVSEGDAHAYLATSIMPAPAPPAPPPQDLVLTVKPIATLAGASFEFSMLSGNVVSIINGEVIVSEALRRIKTRADRGDRVAMKFKDDDGTAYLPEETDTLAQAFSAISLATEPEPMLSVSSLAASSSADQGWVHIPVTQLAEITRQVKEELKAELKEQIKAEIMAEIGFFPMAL